MFASIDPRVGQLVTRSCICDLEFDKLEIIAHPALVDDVLPSLSSYVDGREMELDFLAGDTFGQLLEEL